MTTAAANKAGTETPAPALTIGGVVFDAVPAAEGSFAWNLYVMRVCEEAGLTAFMVPGALSGNLERDGLVVFGQLLRSRRVLELLAGLFVERGTEWSEEQAAQNVERFGHATGIETTVLRTALVQTVLAFFLNGAPARMPSPTSSVGDPSAPIRPDAPSTSGKRRGRAAPGISEPGTPSSGSSPATTPTG